jgi:DNA-binding MarR family transcriptional regulator
VSLWLRSHTSADGRVSPSQLRALVLIDEAGLLPVTQLADEMGAMASSASRLCDRLVAAGLVERRTSSANRRVTFISLTTAGTRLLAGMRQARVAELNALMSGMSAAERDGLLKGLVALGAADEQRRLHSQG